VPYGTHIWQVADACELIDSFKINLAKAKREYLKHKPNRNAKKFSPTDCVPLVNMAWSNSFAKVKNAQKAIKERGWNPLNFVLLDHPKLIPLATTTTTALLVQLHTIQQMLNHPQLTIHLVYRPSNPAP
jgi:hypothetical protein